MVVNPDGSGLTRLSPPAGGDFFPVWSPDGQKLLFSVVAGDLWVMNADGTGRAQLARGFISQYRWSPDGQRIAFLRERTTGRNIFEDLWVMRADGKAPTRIVIGATYPSWSPDGQRIAYASDNMGDNGIHIVNVDGTGDIKITPADLGGFETAWAPDGSAIAFASLGDKDIMLINPDGPVMFRFLSMTMWLLVRRTGPGMPNVIVSPEFAAATRSRSVPGPASPGSVTINVVADKERASSPSTLKDNEHHHLLGGLPLKAPRLKQKVSRTASFLATLSV